MPRYIDVENIKLKGISVFDQNLEMLIPLSDVRKSLQMTPTADVQEVRHGKWDVEDLTPYCSICHRPSEYECDGVHSQPLFCPHCGAKMDLEEKENG